MVCLAERPSIEDLQRNALFAGLPEFLVGPFCEELAVLRIPANQVIFEEGNAGDCLFLVTSGSVRISKTSGGGTQETLGFIEAGNYFGEMALIDGKPRSAQASAVEPTVLTRVDEFAFRRLLSAAPDGLQMNFLRSIVERLRGVNSHFIAELTRKERLSTVGAMANSILHDLRNPITIIKSCAELLLRVESPQAKRYSGVIDQAVDRMMDMIQELLDFARGQSSLQMTRARATQVLDDLDPQLLHLVPKNVHVVRESVCDASIMVDVSRFSRVLLNLIKNATEAMSDGGVLSITLLEEGHSVVFRVADTGVGIPPELQARIFEPFITHGKSKGTGLGLAIVKSVVEAHAGTVTLESIPKVGTTFEIRLPMALA
jgi:signal transduction histidine kinase